ncbi:MAG: hypothetical protein EU551_03470, partial [Promethearchaeota archaeon]
MKIKSKYFYIAVFLLLISFPIFIHLNQNIIYYNKESKNDNIIGIENEDFPWGSIEIFNVTLNKTDIIIGEGILINASYRIILNPDWIIESIQFGIKSSGLDFIGIPLDQQQGNYMEVSRKIFYEPYAINLTESYYGYLEIIAKPIGGEPGEFVLFSKESDEEIDFQKAEIACDIIYQYPEITFYEEDTNISLKFTN